MRTTALFGAKTSDFSKLTVCPYGIGEEGGEEEDEPLKTICGKGGGVNFSRFYADVLYGRPLSLYPNLIITTNYKPT